MSTSAMLKPAIVPPTTLVAQSRIIDAQVIRLYAELTDDFNPIHVDQDFAGKTPFGRTIAHGTLTLALVWQAFDVTFGRDVLAGAEADIRFVKPVLVDTRVSASGTRVPGSRDEIWRVEVTNDDGVVVLSGTVRLAPSTIDRRGSHVAGC
ncbi:MaoC family dehydratase [Paraburkholderia sp. BCC1886]|uniref:MaoC family dehydratase n=1 Tax=Paraburkholderia sp. BCC1886 TaxID=2562670 RepID=UPI001C92790A|nr:MaoC family dehydratase [Paraburkholderia sp. BCC1886]